MGRRTPATNISRERVRQIQMSALGEMRRILFARGYKTEDFFDTWEGTNNVRNRKRSGSGSKG